MFGKTVRIGLKRIVHYNAGHLPMTAGRILCLGFFHRPAIAAYYLSVVSAQFGAFYFAYTERAHIGYIQMTALFIYVAECIRSHVAELSGIRKVAYAGAVKHNYSCSFPCHYFKFPSLCIFFCAMILPPVDGSVKSFG